MAENSRTIAKEFVLLSANVRRGAVLVMKRQRLSFSLTRIRRKIILRNFVFDIL